MGESEQRGGTSDSGTGPVAEAEPPGRATGPDSLDDLIDRLEAGGDDARQEALGAIAGHGGDAAARIAGRLALTPSRAGGYWVLAEALERIGRPAVPSLLDLLDSLRRPRHVEDLYLLQAAAQILGHVGDRRAAPALARALGVLRRAGRSAVAAVARIAPAARIRVHQALAALGSRAGVDDLLEMTGDGRRRVREEVIDLAAQVGDRRFMPALARLYARELDVSEWNARHARLAFREIARRERVDAHDPVFSKLDIPTRGLVVRLLPRVRANGNGHGRTTTRRQLRSA